MNSLTRFFHELFHPHCSHCVEELSESKFCPSCEVLKTEIERIRLENDKLLNRILNPVQFEGQIIRSEPTEVRPKHIPWNVKKQMLEAEDRERARLMREAPIPTPNQNQVVQSIDELEKELNIAERNREKQSS